MAPKQLVRKPAAAFGHGVKPDPRVTKVDMKRVYLVTYPHPRQDPRPLRSKTAPLASPSDFDRVAIENMFLNASRNLVYEGANNQSHKGVVELEQLAVFMEYHQPKPGAAAETPLLPHYHVALQAKRSFRFLPFKRALRLHYKVATHWSCDHSGYHSALRYCARPSPAKLQSDIDPEPRLWAACGTHRPLHEACQEPATAAALQQRRENIITKALELGKPVPRGSEMDLYAAIVHGGFRNSPDDCHAWRRLVAHLKTSAPVQRQGGAARILTSLVM